VGSEGLATYRTRRARKPTDTSTTHKVYSDWIRSEYSERPGPNAAVSRYVIRGRTPQTSGSFTRLRAEWILPVARGRSPTRPEVSMDLVERLGEPVRRRPAPGDGALSVPVVTDRGGDLAGA